MADAVPLDRFVREAGFDLPAAAARARRALEEAGLTHAGKVAISQRKLEAAQQALARTLVRACGDECLRLDRAEERPAREFVRVSGASCEMCGGSNNRRAALACLAVLRRKGIRRVVVVGGTPKTRKEVYEHLGNAGLELRYVEGTASHTLRDAIPNQQWAQLVLIWGSTPLDHKVSELYTRRDRAGDARVLTVPRRGVAALCATILESYAR